jgi:stage II sporulation protein R
VIWKNMENMKQTAKKVIADKGFDYDVDICLKETDFPVKTYGAYTFPAGNYEALEIIIGAGKGHNWWCVLYPGLCSFAQGGYALPAENDLVCGQYILRFRLVDWAHRLTARRQTVLLVG